MLITKKFQIKTLFFSLFIIVSSAFFHKKAKRQLLILGLVEETRVNNALAIFFIAFAVVLKTALMVIPAAIQEAQAANLISSKKGHRAQGGEGSGGSR